MWRRHLGLRGGWEKNSFGRVCVDSLGSNIGHYTQEASILASIDKAVVHDDRVVSWRMTCIYRWVHFLSGQQVSAQIDGIPNL